LTLLKREKLVDEEQLARAVAAVNKFEFVNLSPEMIDPIIAHLISHELANRHSAIPFKREGQQLFVAMSSPLDLRARDEIELKTGYRVTPVAATPHAVQQAIHFHFDVSTVTKQAIASMRLKKDAGQGPQEGEESHAGGFGAGDDPITKLVASIVRGAIDARSSDIHLEPQTNELRVRYAWTACSVARWRSDLRPGQVISHLKILAQMTSPRTNPPDGHITLRHEGQNTTSACRPSVGGGEKIVLRILDKNASRWSLDEVLTSPEDNRKFRELAANPYGMLLLTGPTGSGKTTTLYSVLQLVNTPERNIVTVEDPVEYRLPGITQVQVKPVAGLTFASALRSILRQDPDIT
jgi:type IV pilus assembly protein PilB